MKKLLVSLLMASALLVPALASASIDEGIEYQKIEPPQPTVVPDNKIEVVEMFWYGCPHCFHFEPYLRDWLAHKPKDVQFIRVPAVFNNPAWELDAKAFYTAEELGVLDKIHEPLFNAIHVEGKPLSTSDAIKAFFVAHGVKPKDFDDTFNSFAVYTKVRRAKDLSERYRISGVPSLIVDGKYRTDGPMANGNEGMLRVLNFLIAKEAAARGLKSAK